MTENELIQIIQIFPTILIILLGLVTLVCTRGYIRGLLKTLIWRVNSGSQIKLGDFEIGPIYVSAKGVITKDKIGITSYKDDGTKKKERGNYYIPNRDIFMVHKISPSSEEGELFDILIYLIPHKDALLTGISKVEYYFGHYWKDQVFVSTLRSSGFPISTSAYGPFVCTATLYFTDGGKATISRYIDFEMGQIQMNRNT